MSIARKTSNDPVLSEFSAYSDRAVNTRLSPWVHPVDDPDDMPDLFPLQLLLATFVTKLRELLARLDQ